MKADIFIDDRNVGGLVDWGLIYQMISQGKTLQQVIEERVAKMSLDDYKPEKTRKRWWQR